METSFRAALLAWLNDDATLSSALNSVAEEAPVTSSPPWLGIVSSASQDWGSKDRKGREIRVAMELIVRGDLPASGSDIVTMLDRRIDALPSELDGMEIVTARFLRARAERRTRNLRAILLEYRFRILKTQLENDL